MYLLEAIDPYGFLFVPYLSEEILVPLEIGEVWMIILMEVLEENPVVG